VTVPTGNRAHEQGAPSCRRFVPKDEQELNDLRRRCAERSGPLNDRGRRVMQRAEYYATKLALEIMPGFVDVGRGKQKRPCGPWALATRDIAEIRAFGGAWNGGLIFTPMGHGLVDLDIDVKYGKQGEEDLMALLACFGDIPKTLQWRTPSGGRHILFRAGSRRIPKSIATLGKRPGEGSSGLDVLGIRSPSGLCAPRWCCGMGARPFARRHRYCGRARLARRSHDPVGGQVPH